MAEEKQKESEIGEFEFYKPEDRTVWESFWKTLYDPSTKQILGRTIKSWGQIIIFYIFFYAGLAVIFATCLHGLFVTLNSKSPKWQQDNGLIGGSPGMGFRPNSDKVEEGSLIYWNGKNETQINRWIKILDEFMLPYTRNQTAKDNFTTCSFTNRPAAHQKCRINVNDFGPCSPRESYGYKGPSPCIFLKLNKIYGWEPDAYMEPESNMPLDLKYRIGSLPQINRTQVWVSCNGLSAQDKDFIEKFAYYPSGFPSYHYPYVNVDGYLSPLVAVQVIYPKSNVIIGVECRAWAKNIKYHGGSQDRAGSVQFYVMRDYLNVPVSSPSMIQWLRSQIP